MFDRSERQGGGSEVSAKSLERREMFQMEKKNYSEVCHQTSDKLEVYHQTQKKLLFQISLVSYALAQFCLEFFSSKDTSLPISAEAVSLSV